MAKKQNGAKISRLSAQPRLHQRVTELQSDGTVTHMLPLDLEEPVRLEMTEKLNILLADTMTLRDLYKKSHWQVAGPTFYRDSHLLFDKHYGEQAELVDSIAERIQLLGGVSIAMAADVAENYANPAPSPAAAKKSPSKYRDCWTPTRSSSATSANWQKTCRPARR